MAPPFQPNLWDPELRICQMIMKSYINRVNKLIMEVEKISNNATLVELSGLRSKTSSGGQSMRKHQKLTMRSRAELKVTSVQKRLPHTRNKKELRLEMYLGPNKKNREVAHAGEDVFL